MVIKPCKTIATLVVQGGNNVNFPSFGELGVQAAKQAKEREAAADEICRQLQGEIVDAIETRKQMVRHLCLGADHRTIDIVVGRVNSSNPGSCNAHRGPNGLEIVIMLPTS